MLDQWTHIEGVEIELHRPGKPMDNPFREAFNGRLCAECLNAPCLLADATNRFKESRCYYNKDSPQKPRSAT
jgi:putative transposase